MKQNGPETGCFVIAADTNSPINPTGAELSLFLSEGGIVDHLHGLFQALVVSANFVLCTRGGLVRKLLLTDQVAATDLYGVHLQPPAPHGRGVPPSQMSISGFQLPRNVRTVALLLATDVAEYA